MRRHDALAMQPNLTLGDSLNFTTTVLGYPASDGWTLNFRLIPRVSGTPISITTAADTVDPELHRAQVSAAVTAAWAAGEYSWASWVQKASESYSVSQGSITLAPDPRTASAPLDLRTDAQRALAQARAAFAAWNGTTLMYRIGNRQMQFNTKADIVAAINYWENVVRREQQCATGINDRKIHVRVGRG